VETTFAGRLKQLRKLKGWSQYTLAKKAGVSRSTVKLWELEACEPRMQKLKRLAEVFGVSVDFISGN